MPKCVLRRAETMPMPNSRAIAIASLIAHMPTTKPKASWPSSVAATGVTRLGVSCGRAIDQARAHAIEIARQPAEAMGIDAAQVGADQAAGDGGGVLGRHVVRREQRARECVGGFRRGIDALSEFGRSMGGP